MEGGIWEQAVRLLEQLALKRVQGCSAAASAINAPARPSSYHSHISALLPAGAIPTTRTIGPAPPSTACPTSRLTIADAHACASVPLRLYIICATSSLRSRGGCWPAGGRGGWRLLPWSLCLGLLTARGVTTSFPPHRQFDSLGSLAERKCKSGKWAALWR